MLGTAELGKLKTTIDQDSAAACNDTGSMCMESAWGNRMLTRWQDGVKLVGSKHAHIGDGEVAGAVLVRRQLLASRPLHEVCPRAADLVDVCAVRILPCTGAG